MPLNVPAASIRAAGTAAPETDESLFWKVLGLLNRPSSATFGATSAAIRGEDPLTAGARGLFGEQDYSGTDVLTALGAPEDSFWTKAGGFGLTVLNPLDPLNYVGGLGGVTKAGRAARLAGKALPEWGAAARAGERALLSFAGHRVPIPGDEAILSGMQRLGQGFMGTAPGRAVETLFGGARGPAKALDIPHADEIFGAEDRASRLARMFEVETAPEITALEKLPAVDEGPLLEAVGKAYRGDIAWEHAQGAYIQPGTPGAEARRAAWDAVHEYARKQKGFLSRLEGTGLDAYAEATPGHFKRSPIPLPGTNLESMGAKLYEERIASLKGPSRNAFNKLLIPGGIEPPAVATLTKAGQRDFFAQGGAETFNKLTVDDPEYVREFLRQHRLTPKELNETGEMGFRYETSPARVFKRMQAEAVQNVQADELVKTLEEAGLAKPWDDAAHALQGDDGRYLFAKVDQGRYADRPVAVPAEYAQAFQRMTEVLKPGPDKAAMGAMFNNALPEMARNAGILQWWKGFAIFGGGPSYFVRNYFTGVTKNYYEGLTVWNPQTYRFYNEAFDMIGRGLRKDWGGAYVDLGGVKVSKERLWQEYTIRGVHGGHIPDPDIINLGTGKSQQWREKVFKPARSINEQVEMGIRLPLMMKEIEDTIAVARRAGEQLPATLERLGSAAEAGQDIMAPALSRAFENATAQVKLSHFDYTDLSPFEQHLRNFWVPFYSWMRKNIPHETVNMLTRPGKYMPFARAYYQRYKDAGLTPEDTPEWMDANFAIPLHKTEDGRNQFLDMTGFLPFMDVVELSQAVAGKPRTGQSRQSEAIRYLATRSNPFLVQGAEQLYQQSTLSGRDYGEAPKEMFGATVSPSVAGMVNLFRPARELDRLNPGGVFTKAGNALGTFEGDVRPNRNEPGEAERWARFVGGAKIYGADENEADLSRKRRGTLIKRYRSWARGARADGKDGEAAYFERKAADLEG